MKVTLSVIKADIGGYVGHSTSHPEVLAKAEECLRAAKKDGTLIDYHVANCGDDVQLAMTHKNGEDCRPIQMPLYKMFVDPFNTSGAAFALGARRALSYMGLLFLMSGQHAGRHVPIHTVCGLATSLLVDGKRMWRLAMFGYGPPLTGVRRSPLAGSRVSPVPEAA